MKVLDLFSGIGGFSLGLERAGLKTVAFCETDGFCRKVLAKHWPEVPLYDDICTLTEGRLRSDGIYPDVICGGFPCQDISSSGKKVGLSGARSRLWAEYARLIGEIRPRFVIVENVSALLFRGLGEVLGDLAALGYDAEWHCIPASAIGAIHDRDRVWIIAHPNGVGGISECNGITPERLEASRRKNADRLGLADLRPWVAFSDVLRAPYGVPGTLDRLRVIGNSVVPQIAELIGMSIVRGRA